VQYAELLATAGVQRGLLGPREVLRLWDRHLLNCAVVAELIPPGARVIDVGSGAGLPGLVLALARPDLRITLLEPMTRRVAFLNQAVRELRLTGVDVRRGRAEEGQRSTGRAARPVPEADVVTARAVAPLDQLVRWCLPLVGVGGRLLAIKGRSARTELDCHGDVVRATGGTSARIHRCGVGSVTPPTTVVEIVRGTRRATHLSAR